MKELMKKVAKNTAAEIYEEHKKTILIAAACLLGLVIALVIVLVLVKVLKKKGEQEAPEDEMVEEADEEDFFENDEE